MSRAWTYAWAYLALAAVILLSLAAVVMIAVDGKDQARIRFALQCSAADFTPKQCEVLWAIWHSDAEKFK